MKLKKYIFPHTIGKLYYIMAVICMTAISHLQAIGQSDIIKPPPGVVEGRLPNGLHYMIMHNDNPASRAEFRLIMKAGSLQQTAAEGGCAHFLEHIAFGPSKHFPGRSKVEYLESLGMKYGQDINAFTGLDRTVYMFGVPTDHNRENVIDRSLQIVYDWLAGIIIDSSRVENEKGIILEELHGYDLGDDFYYLKIGQGIHRHRIPLGTAEEIRNMTTEKLSGFLCKWYRPDLASLVIVGDINPQETEQKIISRFSSIRKNDTTAFQHIPLIYEKGVHIMEISDTLQKRIKTELIIPHPSTVQRTWQDALLKQKEELLVSALSSRFRALSLNTYVSDQWYLGNQNHFVLSIEGENQTAISDNIASTVNACKNMIENGWHPEELQHIKNKFVKRMYLPEINGRLSSSWCDDFTDYILAGDRYMTDSTEFRLLQKAVMETSSQELQDILADILKTGSETLLVACTNCDDQNSSFTAENIKASWQKGLDMPCVPFEYSRPEESEEIKIRTPEILARHYVFRPEYIKSRHTYPSLGAEAVILTNGIQLILKKTDDANGEILLTSVSPGSLSSLSREKYHRLADIAGYMDYAGIQDIHPDTLSEYMYQNGMSLMMTIENHWHGFMGMTPNQLAPEFFRLIYEKIYHPAMPQIESENQDEQEEEEGVLSRMLKRDAARQLSAYMNELMGSTLPQTEEYGKASLKKQVSKEEIMAFYKELYTRTTDNTYILCGDFNTDSIIRQFSAIFGQASRNSGDTHLQPIDFKFPEQTIVKGFPYDNKDQITFDYLFFGHYQPGQQQTLLLKLIRDIIRNRLISVIREEKSLVYSPYISLTYEGYPYSIYYFDINAAAKEKNIKEIDNTLKDILTDLQKNPIDNSELEEVKRSFLIAKRETLTEDSPAAWRNTLTNLIKNGETMEEFDKYEEYLERITPDELCKAFRKYIHWEPHVFLYLGNKKLNLQSD